MALDEFLAERGSDGTREWTSRAAAAEALEKFTSRLSQPQLKEARRRNREFVPSTPSDIHRFVSVPTR
jgi:hypothetical protein